MLEIPLSGIKRIEEIAKSSDEYISLSQGSIKIGGIPQQIKNHIQELLKTDKTDYYESCWGLKLLREKLATTLSARYNTEISMHQVLPTHGCIGGLSLLYLALLNPGDEVIVPEPAYPAYALLTQASRATTVFVSCLEHNTTGPASWVLDVDKIKAATTPKTKLIIFSNPWNPLGIVVPRTTINELLAFCEERGIYLVVDEAYRDYVFDGDYESAIPLIKNSEWLISANTFSKNMAMSGWRIGYLLIPQRLNKALAGMQDALLNCLNNTAQFAAIYALDHQEFTEQFHTIIRSNRDLLMKRLQPLVANDIITLNKPQGGFFAFLQTDQQNANDLCMSILNKSKVALIPGDSFGPSGAPFLRLCYARNPEILEEGLDRLVRYFM
jgi:aspartate/methionine/tyrosine aminotransferase